MRIESRNYGFYNKTSPYFDHDPCAVPDRSCTIINRLCDALGPTLLKSSPEKARKIGMLKKIKEKMSAR